MHRLPRHGVNCFSRWWYSRAGNGSYLTPPIDIPELITILQTRHADTVYLDADPTLPYSSVVRLISVARTAGVQGIGLTTLSR
jgi:biopolymer transport protein ExbD